MHACLSHFRVVRALPVGHTDANSRQGNTLRRLARPPGAPPAAWGLMLPSRSHLLRPNHPAYFWGATSAGAGCQ